jgi:hypothetical protein
MNIEIFYHMYCINNCVDRFINTYNKLYESGLIKVCNNVNVVLVGEDNVSRYETQINYLKKVKTKCYSSEIFGEMNTIKTIQEFAQKPESTNTYILYLHSKGVSRNNNKNIEAWVDYMEYFLIENHSLCLEYLKNFDTIGVNYLPTPMPHYSGNFWWATSNFIKSHKTFEEGLKESIITDPRWYCEFWLLHHSKANYKCLHNSNVDLYGTLYTKDKYLLS